MLTLLFTIATEPSVTFSVVTLATTAAAFTGTTYSLSISGTYDCASNTVLNPPGAECTHNPAWDLTAANWQDANVDQLMYDWWFEYTSESCDISQLGANGLRDAKPPDTTKDLVMQTTYDLGEM